MIASENCEALVKEFEGCKLVAYRCPAGIWTIGYGATFYENGQKVLEGDEITQKHANELLSYHLNHVFAPKVANLLSAPTSQNQFDALVDFAFNLGAGALAKSTLLKLHNQADYEGAAEEFAKWNKAGGHVLDGLTRRREAEKELYCTEDN